MLASVPHGKVFILKKVLISICCYIFFQRSRNSVGKTNALFLCWTVSSAEVSRGKRVAFETSFGIVVLRAFVATVVVAVKVTGRFVTLLDSLLVTLLVAVVCALRLSFRLVMMMVVVEVVAPVVTYRCFFCLLAVLNLMTAMFTRHVTLFTLLTIATVMAAVVSESHRGRIPIVAFVAELAMVLSSGIETAGRFFDVLSVEVAAAAVTAKSVAFRPNLIGVVIVVAVATSVFSERLSRRGVLIVVLFLAVVVEAATAVLMTHPEMKLLRLARIRIPTVGTAWSRDCVVTNGLRSPNYRSPVFEHETELTSGGHPRRGSRTPARLLRRIC